MAQMIESNKSHLSIQRMCQEHGPRLIVNGEHVCPFDEVT